MKVVYNGTVLNDTEVNINLLDRGFLYGDGFFETFFCAKNKIPHFLLHYNRIQNALKVFNFNQKTLPTDTEFYDYIIKLATLNNLNNTRVKIIFWRTEGGLYNTANTSYNYLITTVNLEALKSNSKTACFQKKGTNTLSDFSPFKPLSGFKYIHAGLELNKSKFEEIIILSESNKVSEALYSNIFWGKENTIYTPSLKTGCIAGIMRNLVINYLTSLNVLVIETEVPKEAVLSADFVFTTNSLGIQSIAQIENKVFTENPLIKKMISELLTKYLN